MNIRKLYLILVLPFQIVYPGALIANLPVSENYGGQPASKELSADYGLLTVSRSADCGLLTEDLISGGTIKGKLTDADTKQPLISANVILLNTNYGAAADPEGNFIIANIPPGTYSVKISYIGYESKIKTDIVVRPDRITFLNEELKPSGLELESVEVTSGYFNTDEPEVSATSFSYEEIRRAPGSGGDISRTIMGLPSLAKVNDQSNSLIVRGGSPSENSFYIDNIEVPNINHFPSQGSSGGPIGMVNVDFIKDLNFYSGGFSSLYGTKLSSVMEINFREGNRDEIDGQLDLNFSGFGGVAEGPLFNKGSWLISARRSYLDLLVKAIDIGTSVAPRYGDFQWKLVYDITPSDKISLLGLFGDDHSSSDEKTAEENKMEAYGVQDYTQGAAGINWQRLWGSSGFSNTSFSYTSTGFKETFFKPVAGTKLLDNNSDERKISLRNVNHFRINEMNSIDFGFDAKYIFNSYKAFYGETRDVLGNIIPAGEIIKDLNASDAGIFINYTVKPFSQLTAAIGFRSDYYSYSDKLNFDPRIALNYKLTSLTSLNASAGIFHQSLPLILLSQKDANKKLKSPQAIHYVLGVEHLLTDNTKLTIEIYDKEYYNFPIDPSQPSLFIIDENIYGNIFYSFHDRLMDEGRAYSRGAELTIQKKLAQDFYGLASFSYFRTRYKAADNTWRDRMFDNQVILSLEGGYKPNNEWEFSARWIYAGGVPYTPFNVEASQQANTGIRDAGRINEERYPDYHSLNIRADKRFLFSKTNLVVYISIWNAYSRKNAASYYWNSFKNEQDIIYQWTLLPIFGVEYEF
ncbi:MAG: TonB-dependent receptor [Ignavibacteriaceae bacterium]